MKVKTVYGSRMAEFSYGEMIDLGIKPKEKPKEGGDIINVEPVGMDTILLVVRVEGRLWQFELEFRGESWEDDDNSLTMSMKGETFEAYEVHPVPSISYERVRV